MTEQTYTLLIDGAQVVTDDHFTVLNPASEDVVGYAPKASVVQLDEAVQAARKAFKVWQAVSDEERQQACMDIATKIEEHSEELARLLTQEQGKPLNGLGSRFEIGGARAWTQVTAALQLVPKVLQDTEDGKVVLHRKPIGVVGSITPWNWPVMIAIWHIIPAVRTGNTVVCKPSPFTPLSTIRLIELMNEVLPAGVVNCITGDDRLGAAMSSHPDIDKIVFTGSWGTPQKFLGR
jgi:acyl-CoA reductase-like NAD-dependent aldehyde dehydrogenase